MSVGWERAKALRRGGDGGDGGGGDGGGAHHERVVNRWRHARGDIWTGTNRAEPRCPSSTANTGHRTPSRHTNSPDPDQNYPARRGEAARRAGWLQLISHSARSVFRLSRRSRTGRDITAASGWTPSFWIGELCPENNWE